MEPAIKQYDDEPPMPASERSAWPYRRALTVASLCMLTVTMLISGTANAAEKAPRVNTLRAPEGGIQPQAAVGREGTLHLIYFLGDPRHGNLFYVTLAVNGDDFSKPLPVNRRPDSAVAIGNVRGAHLALGRDDRVHVAWMGSDKAAPKAPEDASPMLYTRLNDQGTEFEPERNVIQRHVGLDGGGSLAADEQGNVYVAWHAPEAGRTGEANRQVWVARSEDEGRTFAPEQPATQGGGCCACCGMRAFADRDGRLYLLYRSASETVHRDMFLLVSQQEDAGFASSRIAPWEVPACVMSTAALSPAPFGVLAGWETEGQAYFGVVDVNSGKLSRSIAAPGDAKDRKHPAVAANQRGEVILAWTEGMGWNRGGAV
ncbi:MAG TPA: hypothetical protein VHC19_18415, partial [Pirellulales bacterium]|nr:hypothetical protein [Pirellulales bacterium]